MFLLSDRAVPEGGAMSPPSDWYPPRGQGLGASFPPAPSSSQRQAGLGQASGMPDGSMPTKSLPGF